MKNNKGFGLSEFLLVLFIFLVCILIAIYYFNQISGDIGITLINNNLIK